MKILQDHAAALKRGMAALPQTDAFIASHFKVCADCLSRVVITHFPSHILNWAEEIPLRIKNEEEEIRHKESVDYTKRHILKGRRIAQTWTGWMTVLSSPFAAVFAYAAIKKPSLVTVALATGTTAWTGYNGIRYNIITNLPAPTDEQVYKIWAHNKNLELP